MFGRTDPNPIALAGTIAACWLFLGAQCTPIPAPPPPPEGVVLAYAAGGLGERVAVRASRDGVNWSDTALPAPLSQLDGAPNGVGMAADASGLGLLVAWGLGPTNTRSKYGLGSVFSQANPPVTWDSQVRNDDLASPGTAPSIAPFGQNGTAWLFAYGIPAPDGTMQAKLLLQPTAVPDAPGDSPRVDVALPQPAITRLAGRPIVFARGRSRVLLAYQPDAGHSARVFVHAGDANPAQSNVTWEAIPWIRSLNEGWFNGHGVQGICLSGDGDQKFVMGALLAGTDVDGPQKGQQTRLVRLFRSSNGGRSFEPVQILLQSPSNPGATFPTQLYVDKASLFLGCALLPGGTDMLVTVTQRFDDGTVGSQVIRVAAAGTYESVPQPDLDTKMFNRPPQMLPFALMAIGRAANP